MCALHDGRTRCSAPTASWEGSLREEGGALTKKPLAFSLKKLITSQPQGGQVAALEFPLEPGG
jgi:hypothetical protein